MDQAGHSPPHHHEVWESMALAARDRVQRRQAQTIPAVRAVR